MATSKELDFIYSTIDDCFQRGEFEIVNSLLTKVAVENRDPDVLLAYLTATLAAKSKLPYRSEFYAKVEEEFKKRVQTDSEYRDPTLLQGLKS